MGRSQKLYKKAEKIIPGGTQLLSKRPEMFLPDQWPAYYKKANGCEVWDLDGKKYIDMSYMGIGACVLGYADKDVNRAVESVISEGSTSTLNAAEDIQLAQILLKLHPWAEMARYARTGGEAMAIATRIARAKTGKDMVLFCGYHGWHDWYLAANLSSRKSLDGHLLPGLEPKGVPRVLKGSVKPFIYNDTNSFLKLIGKYQAKIAAVIMEPVRNHFPQEGFLETVRAVTDKSDIALIFDEITSGWRLCVGGAHKIFGIQPDIAVFAKGMSNGFPMAAIIGRKRMMEAAQDTFISSTYWTEKIGPAAAIATINKLRKFNVPEYLIATGKKIQEGWKKIASNNQLDIEVSGIYPLSHFSFRDKNFLVLKTLFTQYMLNEGFLATTAFYSSFAHKAKYIAKYLDASDRAFYFIRKAVKSGNPRKFLKGPVCQTGFKRLV
jgi:glutamate-1-semialdehyde aminotransferase